MLLTISYSESAYLITPVEPLKSSVYDYFGISIQHILNIYISHVLLIFFTFLTDTADKKCVANMY